MSNIFVSGLLNLECSVAVSSFPVEYCPIEYAFDQTGCCPGGVGFNLAKALHTLGDAPTLLSYLGNDLPGKVLLQALAEEGIPSDHVRAILPKTPLSIVLFDEAGQRKIYCDLKDLQDRAYEPEAIDFHSFPYCCLTNISFSRPLLRPAKEAGSLIATDVHVLSDVDDAYNRDFLSYADILFLSNAAIKGHEDEFAKRLYERYGNRYIGIGCGEEGALLYIGAQESFVYVPAYRYGKVVSTVGAGDALFACFIHFLAKGSAPEEALRYATMFAGAKITANGASEGFIDEAALQRLAT